jgi:hypothetical protein
MKVNIKSDYKERRSEEYPSEKQQLDEIWRCLVLLLNVEKIKWGDIPGTLQEMLVKIDTVKKTYPREDKLITYSLDGLKNK